MHQNRPLGAAWWAAIGVSMTAIAIAALGDSGREWLAFDRAAISSGEYWRLLTAHLTHLSWQHLLYNLAGLSVITYLVGPTLKAGEWAVTWSLAMPTISAGLWFWQPDLAWYVGLSGVLHALLGAGLVARKARQRGLEVPPYVKTSLAPGSKVVTDYLIKSQLLEDLEAVGFFTVGYGCTTCIGNSGPLPDAVSAAINDNDLVVASVLSGNRNFEGRIPPLVKASYLASPPLVVAFALAGRVVNTGIAEVPMGMTLREIIYDIGGGIPEDKAFKAVQMGGPSGGCLPESLLDLPVDYETINQTGAIVGSFLTGFVLVAALPTRPIVIGIGVGLIVAGVLIAWRIGRVRSTRIVALALALALAS